MRTPNLKHVHGEIKIGCNVVSSAVVRYTIPIQYPERRLQALNYIG